MASRPLTGSERSPLPDSRALGPADPAERLEVTVVVRPADRPGLQDRLQKVARGERSAGHLSRAEFARRHGASRADLDAVREFAEAHGLAVVQEHAGRRAVVLSGTVAQFNDAFGIELQHYSHPGGTYRGRTGPVHIPGRAGRHDRGRARSRQPSAGQGALPHEEIRQPAAVAAGPCGGGFVHAATARLALCLSARRRQGRMHRAHRAGRRLPAAGHPEPTSAASVSRRPPSQPSRSTRARISPPAIRTVRTAK